MKKLPRNTSKHWLTGAAAGLATFAGGDRLAATPWVDVSDLSIRRDAPLDRYAAGYEGVLGTSLDLIVEAARPSDALACERRLLGEIERLRQILSTYDPASEISRVMAGAPIASAELAELLAAYELWSTRTGGLIDINLGGTIDEWREANRTGRLPDVAALARAAARSRAWNVDALGKGFIIDRAVAVARRLAPGGLINLGGDLRAWGGTDWLVGVADPRNPADNLPPLTQFRLHEAAVATSGGYARYYEIGGQRFSHLIDPRTSRPLAVGGSATVVAPDSVTANALSTAASIGGAETGAVLAQANSAAGYLFADSRGQISSGGMFVPMAAATKPASSASAASPESKSAEDAARATATPAPADANWPAGFQVAIQVALKKHTGPRTIYRPYVVVWIQNPKGFLLRTLTLWGEDSRYQRTLRSWWRIPREGTDEPQMTARATRPAGAYTLAWDGKDDFGKKVPAGEYTISLEICREDGHHVVETVNVTCAAEPVTVNFRETAESDVSSVSYGPPKS